MYNYHTGIFIFFIFEDGERGPAWAAYRMFDKTFDDFTNFGYTALNCPQCGCSFEEKISAQCDLHEILVENECVCKENMVKSRRICVCDDGYILENDECIDIDECLLDICSKA